MKKLLSLVLLTAASVSGAASVDINSYALQKSEVSSIEVVVHPTPAVMIGYGSGTMKTVQLHNVKACSISITEGCWVSGKIQKSGYARYKAHGELAGIGLVTKNWMTLALESIAGLQVEELSQIDLERRCIKEMEMLTPYGGLMASCNELEERFVN